MQTTSFTQTSRHGVAARVVARSAEGVPGSAAARPARAPAPPSSPAPLWHRATNLVYAICRTYCTSTSVHYPFQISQCRRATTNLGKSRRGSSEEGGLRVVAMTSQATGDEQDPPPDQPPPRRGAGAGAHPPPAADPAAAARGGVVLRGGRPPRRAAALHRPYPRLDP